MVLNKNDIKRLEDILGGVKTYFKGLAIYCETADVPVTFDLLDDKNGLFWGMYHPGENRISVSEKYVKTSSEEKILAHEYIHHFHKISGYTDWLENYIREQRYDENFAAVLNGIEEASAYLFEVVYSTKDIKNQEDRRQRMVDGLFRGFVNSPEAMVEFLEFVKNGKAIKFVIKKHKELNLVSTDEKAGFNVISSCYIGPIVAMVSLINNDFDVKKALTFLNGNVHDILKVTGLLSENAMRALYSFYK